MLVKLFFSSNINPDQVIYLLEQMKNSAKNKLNHYIESQKHVQVDHYLNNNMKQGSFYWSLTAEYGIKHEEMVIKWCEESINKIQGAQI